MASRRWHVTPGPRLINRPGSGPRPTCVGVVDHLPELGEEGGHVGAGGAELGGQRDLYHGQHLDSGQWSPRCLMV